jgi:hypothetical protein
VSACASEVPVAAPPGPEPMDAPHAAAAVDARALPASPLASRPPAGNLPVPDPPPARAGADAEIWSVDGRAVTTSDLGDFVLRYSPDRAAEALDQLLDEAVIRAEAARERVSVADAVVAARTDAWIDDRRREARVQYGATTDFEKLLRERYGRDLASYRADAERIVGALCLRDRLVRVDQFREDGVEVRVLVLPAKADADAAAKSLRDGADMTLFAERAGLRRPATPAPAARGEIPEKEVEARLFAAAAGDVLDPVPFDVAGKGTFWQVFKVTRAWRGSSEPWTALAARVEESLAGAPVTDDEYLRWRRRAFARHRIETRDAAKALVRAPGGPSSRQHE